MLSPHDGRLPLWALYCLRRIGSTKYVRVCDAMRGRFNPLPGGLHLLYARAGSHWKTFDLVGEVKYWMVETLRAKDITITTWFSLEDEIHTVLGSVLLATARGRDYSRQILHGTLGRVRSTSFFVPSAL